TRRSRDGEYPGSPNKDRSKKEVRMPPQKAEIGSGLSGPIRRHTRRRKPEPLQERETDRSDRPRRPLPGKASDRRTEKDRKVFGVPLPPFSPGRWRRPARGRRPPSRRSRSTSARERGISRSRHGERPGFPGA